MNLTPAAFIEQRANAWWLVFAVGMGVLFSFAMDWQASEAQMQSVARERGAALFRLVEMARSWNAGHGGVYVPVTEKTQPNPYLEHPRRDVITLDGLTLTMINPAFMTRQIADIAEAANGIRIHLTSSKPIRPANKPLEWESVALDAFEQGLSESIDFVAGVVPVHRYMAPLRVQPACMTCHEKQGYHVGQIRGGISVTMPAAELLSLRDRHRWRSAGGHVLVFALLSGLLVLLMSRTRTHLRELQQINLVQETTIAQRTSSLSQANERLEAEVAQRQVQATVFDHVAEGIVVLDTQGVIRQVNPAFSRLTGYVESEALGQGISFLQQSTADLQAVILEGLAKDGRWQGELATRSKTGAAFTAWLSITGVGASNPSTYVGTLSDISERKLMEEQLRHLSQHDVLTGLPNRALFADRLQMAITQSLRHQRMFAVMALDLDYFKQVNDTYGHAVGDRLLVETAKRLLACVRGSDTVARMGGDEFSVILSEFSAQSEVGEVAARIVEKLAQAFELGEAVCQVSASIGVAMYPVHGLDADTLLANADASLYQVKRGGRNAYRMFDPLTPI